MEKKNNQNKNNIIVNCFAFYQNKGGKNCCRALTDIYCLNEDSPCSFQATPEEAMISRHKAQQRLMNLNAAVKE